MLTNTHSVEHLNDTRIKSVEGYFPCTMVVHAVFASDEDQNPSGFHYSQIHMWAKVVLEDGTAPFIGLTLDNMRYGGHAELDEPGQLFIEYSDDPNIFG